MQRRLASSVSVLLLAVAALLIAPRAGAQCVSLTTVGTPATQNFDSLTSVPANNIAWTDDSTIAGWYSTRTTFNAGTGTSNTGALWDFGVAGTNPVTERALGGIASGGTGTFFWAACFTNNTGAPLTAVDIAYIGEQWRDGGAAVPVAQPMNSEFQVAAAGTITDADTPTTGWVAAPAGLNFSSPTFTNTGAGVLLDGNAPANRQARAATIAVAVPLGQQFWIRWRDINDGGNDHGLAVDDFSITPQGPPPNPPVVPTCPATVSTTFGSATTAPVSATDSNGTVTAATITSITPSDPGTITLTGFTPAGGVGGTANATLDVTNTTPVGSYNVTIQWSNNDGVPQTANCVVAVNVTAPVVITFIHDIQGSGTSSPIVGNNVNIRGIVTGVKSNGFFVQEEDVDADANPNTSEGIFVFTSAAPPVAAAFTAQVEVNGTVLEFVPSQDLQQPPLTELSGTITVTQLAPPGQPLPTAITLTTTNPDPSGPFDQMEKYEGMRVSAGSMTVTGPSDGSISEANATGTSNGRFHAAITGVARPFREPGIRAPDLAPTGTIPPIPRWDTNPENLRVESASINGQPVLTVKSGDVISAMVGPLDYGFRGYAIYPDGTLGTPVVTPATLNTIVMTPMANELTIASFNLQHFFDTVNDPESDIALTATAFNNRLLKASIAIRNHLKFPDIVGVQEMEHLATLQALATQINNDAVANAQPSPLYVAFLDEGNDSGGIDVGYLVKTSTVPGGAQRVSGITVTQVGAATTYIDPTTGSPDTLNDRPPLVLEATINKGPGQSFPVVVINNHLRSLLGLTDETPSGPTTIGDRIRRKRQIQADFLAQYIQSRPNYVAGENLIVIGDMNNFEFNDGYQHSLATLAGTPVPDNETVVCSTCPQAPNTGDGVDPLNPDLTNLVNTPPAPERYSYVFDGNAQNIDHALVSQFLITSTSARRIEHPRIDSDYPETERNVNTTAFRISDHDPVVAYFSPIVFSTADLDITKTDSPDPVNAGTDLTYTITVTNIGPDPATTVAWSDTIPAGTTFFSVSSVAGWSCSDPGVGNNGLVSCSNPSFAVGSAVFTLVVHVDATVVTGTVLSNTASVTSTTGDPDSGDLSDTETTTVAALADLQLSKTDSPDPVVAGTNLTYQITMTNNGPSNAASASFSDTLPAGTTFVSLSTTGPWSCSTPAVGMGGTVSCTNPSFGVTVDFFTIVVNVNSSVAAGTVLSNTATISSSTTDPTPGNASDTATTTVSTSADLQLTKTDSPDPVTAGTNLTYTITLTNAGPSDAASASFSDALPAGTTFVSLSTTGSWSCSTPAVGTNGTVSCTNTSFGVTVDFFTIVVNVDPSTAAFTVHSNTASISSATSDPNTGNESSTATTTVSQSADLAVTITDAPDPVIAGNNITYTITLTNNGPSDRTELSGFTTVVPSANTTFVSATNTTGSGWSLIISPAPGGTGNIVFSKPAGMVAGESAVFSVVVNVNPGTPVGTIISNLAGTSSGPPDPNDSDNMSTTTTTVGAGSADLSVTKTDSPDPISAGSTLTYTITATNAGPDTAVNVSVSDTIPAGTTFLNLQSPGGWSCGTPGVGGTGTLTCTIATFPSGGNAVFTLLVQVNSALANGTIITNTANVTSTTPDPVPGNNSATSTTTVSPITNFTATKSVTGTFVSGTTVTYTVILTNNMGHTQNNNFANEFADILPAGLALTGATASSGTILTILPSNIVTWNGSIANGATVTITITATITAGSGTISNQGNAIIDTDNSGLNESAVFTDDPSTAAPGDPTAFTIVPVGAYSATKTVSGTFVTGSNVTYTIVLTNALGFALNDNPGNELDDVLPAGLTLVSASATSGTAVATIGTNTVTWNGTIANGSSVTITITATITATSGTISNQGTAHVDQDNNGTNETNVQTDAPGGASGDATAFVIAPATGTEIPTLSFSVLLALAALLACGALLKMTR